MAPAAPGAQAPASSDSEGPREDASAAKGRGAAAEAAPERRSPLGFAQIAFAGHSRPEDMGGDAQISVGLAAAWAMLSEAGLSEARLLSGFAGGSDVIAVETWRTAGLGAIQIVLPFLDQTTLPEDLSATATRLDGARVRANLRSPHLAQSRWLVGAADLLVAVWNGQAPRGSGGTADTVRLALAHGVPVLWFRPGVDGGLRLLRPEFLFEDCGFLELIDQLASDKSPLVIPATPQALHAALSDLGLDRPQPVLSASEGDEEARPRLAWPWGAYGLFRRTLGGKRHVLPNAVAPPDLASQPGFRLLTSARAAAAQEAQRLGAVHRSKQVVLLAIAITMAAAGSAPALWPAAKLPLVSIELILAVLAFIVWIGSERGEHHLRWGSARKRAEDLRLERAAWVLGVSTVPHDPVSTNTSVARHARRLAALPQGAFDQARVRSWGTWVVDELLSRQAAYHHDQAVINGRISHRVHQVENVSFAVLLGLLGLYIVVAVGSAMAGGEAPKWLAGLAVMGGAIVPAIGAAGLALEATLSLDTQAHRSQVLRRQLDTLKADLGSDWRLEDLQGVARTAIKLQRAQEDHWSDDAGRRRLFRGG